MNPTNHSEQLSQEKQQEFLKSVREKISNWLDKQDDYDHKRLLKHAPDFFYVLHKLSSDDSIEAAQKSVFESAMFYFVLPMDVIPEGVQGPEGYADDIIVSAMVLDDQLGKNNRELIGKYWPSDSDPNEIIDRVLETAEEWVGGRRLEKIENWIEENTIK